MRVLLIKNSPVVMQNGNLRGNYSPRADRCPWLIRVTIRNAGRRRTLQCSPQGTSSPILAASLRNRDALRLSADLAWQVLNRNQISDLTAIRSTLRIPLFSKLRNLSIILEHVHATHSLIRRRNS